ncbi:hypothetical protein HDE_10928 [Halotydeus destructor]|nr:hypothetical protein HDE_10928 [Halotydeus destructor]
MFLNGIQVYDDKCKTANKFFRVLFIVYNYFHLGKNIYAFELNAVNMKKFVFICVHLTAILSHHSLLVKAKGMRHFYKSMVTLMPTEQRDHLRIVARKGLTLWLLGVSCGLASGILRCYRYGTDRFLLEEYLIDLAAEKAWYKHLFVATDILLFNILSIGWYLGTVVIYAHTLNAIGQLDVTYFTIYGDLKRMDNLKDHHSHYHSMRVVWHKMAAIKETFDEIFSLQPFLWFVCLFIECSLTLILFKYDYQSYATQSILTIFIDNWSLYFLRAIFVSGATFAVDKVNSRGKKLYLTFSGTLLEKNQRHCDMDVFFLVSEIRQSLTIKSSCWGAFNLNKTVILMFVNSVIPFSVLVLDLVETIIKARV